MLPAGRAPCPRPLLHLPASPITLPMAWPCSLGPLALLVHPGNPQAAPVRSVGICEEKQSGGRGAVPGEKLGFGEQGAPNWRLGDRKPSPHPASSPTAGTRPGNHGKGNLIFSCFALNPFLSPSSGQLLGSPHPAPTPTPKTPILGLVRAGMGPDPRLPHLHLGCRGPLPSPLLGALGCTDGPSHVHPHPHASPLHAGRARVLSSSQHQPALTVCPSPKASFCQAHACPTGGPGQRCLVPSPGTPCLPAAETSKWRRERRRRKALEEPETAR